MRDFGKRAPQGLNLGRLQLTSEGNQSTAVEYVKRAYPSRW